MNIRLEQGDVLYITSSNGDKYDIYEEEGALYIDKVI